MDQKSLERHRFGNKILTVSACLAFILLNAGGIFAQGDKQYQPPKETTGEPGQSNSALVVSPDEDYLIGASDVIEIKIEDAPELSGTFRLNAKGTLTLPTIGQLAAENKTTEALALLIADKLRGNYLMNPIVAVKVKQSNSRTFFIQGAVRRPGIYQIEGRPSLLKLITISGGLADNYGSTAYIMREKKPSKETAEALRAPTLQEKPDSPQNTVNEPEKSVEYELIKANINNLLRGNLEQNIIIAAGDIVHIPQSDIFFVAGEVKSPGSFQLREGTTLRQAISLAQGTNFEGNLDQSVIFREDLQTGKREEIKIDVGAIMAGKKEDIPILANDIIIVPNNKKKTIAKSLLKTFGGALPRILLGF
ncbi:MAG TPA: polysaccharide biosynthesis/export family protein [Pyrinomonadaceae bacterium]|nr:polysaccharide biosynthesis/export family protein [Pyrinomonadaceae bacterium]